VQQTAARGQEIARALITLVCYKGRVVVRTCVVRGLNA